MSESRAEVVATSKAERVQALIDNLTMIHEQFREFKYCTRSKPMYGGVFGEGDFSLTSVVIAMRTEHSIWFLVTHTPTGFPFTLASTRDEAVSAARDLLTPENKRLLLRHVAVLLENQRVAEREAEENSRRAMAEVIRKAQKRDGRARNIPRRRKRIFEESEGKCHYCATALTLDGEWHIEHKFPKALGGTDEPNNLVASCIPCNKEKIDTTDVEFKAKLAKRAAA